MMLAMASTLATTALARPLTEDETGAVEPKMEELGDAMETGDVKALTGGIPEEVMQAIADKGNISVDDLRGQLEEFTEELLTKVEFSDVKYDLENVDMTEGEEVDYGFAMVDFTIHANNQKQNSAAPVLLLHKHDPDEWYTMRVDEAQLPMVKSIYPDLAELELPQ